jgi:outer membrane protein
MTRSVPTQFRFFRCLSLLAYAFPAFAAGLIAVESQAAEKVNTGWLMAVGGATISAPQFPGSETYSFISLLPAIVASPTAADSYIAPDDSLSLALFSRDPQFSLGAVGRYNADAQGIGSSSLIPGSDQRWAIEPGIFAEFWPEPNALRIRGELRMGSDGATGMVGSVGADFVQQIGGLVFSAGPRLSLAGSDYVNAQSGIGPVGTPGESGMRSLGASGLVKFVSRDHWSTALYANYDRAVDGQPTRVTSGTANDPASVSIGASFNYVFPIPRPSDLGE